MLTRSTILIKLQYLYIYIPRSIATALPSLIAFCKTINARRIERIASAKENSSLAAILATVIYRYRRDWLIGRVGALSLRPYTTDKNRLSSLDALGSGSCVCFDRLLRFAGSRYLLASNRIVVAGTPFMGGTRVCSRVAGNFSRLKPPVCFVIERRFRRRASFRFGFEFMQRNIPRGE